MKVVIIADAEQMAFGIGNVLLKTLEEPPLDCLLVLTSSVPERLLPTIRSRCQRIGFAPLTPDWMAPRLALLHPDAGSADLRTAAYLSQGSVLAAERHLSGVLRDVRDRAFAILLAAAQSDPLELLQLAHSTARGYANQRHLFPVLLQILASVARDALLVAEGAATLPAGAAAKSSPATTLPDLVHEDRLADLRQVAQAFDAMALRNIVRQAQRAERQIAGYAHAELTLGSFFLALARARVDARPQSARA
jgi:DNA polymerase III gamma/tau subunit